MMKPAAIVPMRGKGFAPARPCVRQGVDESPFNPPTEIALFEQLILPHLNAAYNLARWLTRNESDAQDVAQEAYLRAFRFFGGYQGGDAKSWLLAIVRNTCHTWRQREKRVAAVIPFDEAAHSPSLAAAGEGAPNAEEWVLRQARADALKSCIEALPLEYREVLVMRELEEMSYRQIAEVAGLAIGTVMSRLSRARKRLEECVGSWNSGGFK
jgi:RNA polymerase sigma-70 factor (ECF subfamily)